MPQERFPSSEGSQSERSSKSALLVIFLTVFIDLVGFGMVIPLLPYLAVRYEATSFQVGLLMSIYSGMQFLFSPFWGRLSDRVGRRPIMLLSLLGSSTSYLGFALGGSLASLFISRFFAGLFGANISTAMACIADVTSEKDRSKGMGLIGAAFGLGFVLGPFLGGILGDVGMQLGSEPPFGMNFSALVAAIICFANFILACFVLKESYRKSTNQAKRMGRLRLLVAYISRPVLGSLMIAFFLSGLAMANMEATLFLLVKDRFGWGLKTASFGFAYVGIVMALVQGYLVRKWMPRFGERKMLFFGFPLIILGFLGIGIAQSIWVMAIVITLMALGNGLMHPSLLGTISLTSSADEQGITMGVTQSLASLARILGPALGGFVYLRLGQAIPFYFAAGFALIGMFMLLAVSRQIPSKGHR